MTFSTSYTTFRFVWKEFWTIATSVVDYRDGPWASDVGPWGDGAITNGNIQSLVTPREGGGRLYDTSFSVFCFPTKQGESKRRRKKRKKNSHTPSSHNSTRTELVNEPKRRRRETTTTVRVCVASLCVALCRDHNSCLLPFALRWIGSGSQITNHNSFLLSSVWVALRWIGSGSQLFSFVVHTVVQAKISF